MTPKLQRDIAGQRLVRALARFGYEVTRQSGSHLRLTTHTNGEHHIKIPDHVPIKIGTLSGILAEIAAHFEISKNELISKLFG